MIQIMKLLVTGGAGYIGSVVSAQLVEAGHEVTVLDDLSSGFPVAIPAAATFITSTPVLMKCAPRFQRSVSALLPAQRHDSPPILNRTPRLLRAAQGRSLVPTLGTFDQLCLARRGWRPGNPGERVLRSRPRNQKGRKLHPIIPSHA